VALPDLFKSLGTSGLEGELGVIKNPDGSRSTERSITVTDPRLNQGRPTNIPSLVKGQNKDNVQNILSNDRMSDSSVEMAVRRALARQTAGEFLPSFNTIGEAERAAALRSDSGQAQSRKVMPQSQRTLDPKADEQGRKLREQITQALGQALDKKTAIPGGNSLLDLDKAIGGALSSAVGQGFSAPDPARMGLPPDFFSTGGADLSQFGFDNRNATGANLGQAPDPLNRPGVSSPMPNVFGQGEDIFGALGQQNGPGLALDAPGPSGGLNMDGTLLSSVPQMNTQALQIPAQDFNQLRAMLEGLRPPEAEQQSKFERLAQVLGGLAQGSLAGGNQLGGILAGAGAGGIGALGEVNQMDRLARGEAQRQNQQFQQAQFNFESQTAKALHDAEVFNAGKRHEAEMIDAGARQPKVTVTGGGMFLLEQTEVDENGNAIRNTTLYDPLKAEREAKLLLESGKLNSRDPSILTYGKYSRMLSPLPSMRLVESAVKGVLEGVGNSELARSVLIKAVQNVYQVKDPEEALLMLSGNAPRPAFVAGDEEKFDGALVAELIRMFSANPQLIAAGQQGYVLNTFGTPPE